MAPDHASARVIARQEDIGWSLLCNTVIVFDDTGEILPNGTTVRPNRPAPPSRRVRAHSQPVAAAA